MRHAIKKRSYKPEAGESVAHEKGEPLKMEKAEHGGPRGDTGGTMKKTGGKGLPASGGKKVQVSKVKGNG